MGFKQKLCAEVFAVKIDAGWSSLVARRAHNPKVVGSNPAPATKASPLWAFFVSEKWILNTLKTF